MFKGYYANANLLPSKSIKGKYSLNSIKLVATILYRDFFSLIEIIINKTTRAGKNHLRNIANIYKGLVSSLSFFFEFSGF
jgi:hypothetical protein